jgi:hypothetical protein
LTSEDWANFLEEKLLKRSFVCVKGYPSSAKVTELEKATAAREELTRSTLGVKGLQQKV